MTLSTNRDSHLFAGPHPRTIRYCEVCHDYEPHDLRPEGISCVGCAALLLTREANRD